MSTLTISEARNVKWSWWNALPPRDADAFFEREYPSAYACALIRNTEDERHIYIYRDAVCRDCDERLIAVLRDHPVHYWGPFPSNVNSYEMVWQRE